MELKFWGIDENMFRERTRDKFEILQEVFDRPVHQFFESSEGTDFFYKNLETNRLDFKDLYESKQFIFKDEFRIRRMRELVEVEYGPNFQNKTEVGRVCVLDHDNSEQLAFEGQMILDEHGKYCLDGYGRYVGQKIFNMGLYKNHLLNGEAKFLHIDGKV